MKILLTFTVFIFLSLSVDAQGDTLTTSNASSMEIYDVVAIYRNHTDGRGRNVRFTSEIRGKIIAYDEGTGVLTFKGIDEKMYSLTSEQYKYFQYDKEFATKKKKVRVKKPIHPRKDSGFEFSIGLCGGALNVQTGFEQDTNFVGGLISRFDELVCLKAGASKYFNKNSSAGLSAEYAVVNSEVSYFNLGARYQYLYNPAKNTALYFPIEMKFSRYQGEHYYQVDEVVFTNEGSSWPKEINALVTLDALELNLGQGVSFSLANKRSISLEIMLLNQFVLSEKIELATNNKPNTRYGINGLKLSVSMNF